MLFHKRQLTSLPGFKTGFQWPSIVARPLSFLLGRLHHAASGFTPIGSCVVPFSYFCQRTLLIIAGSVFLAACSAGPQVTTAQELAEDADAPYEKVLVIALFSSFDSRRYLEDEIVRHLAELGTEAVASTSMMNTKTPLTRQTFVAMVDEIDADALLVTQLVSLETTVEVKNMRPETTYNFRPTYYYNVWSVELTEYTEPQALEFDNILRLATQVYSVRDRDAVWAIESKTKIVQRFDNMQDYSIFVDEAKAIVENLSSGGLIAN